MFDLTASLSDPHSDACVPTRALPDSVQMEIADAFPDRPPTADELEAEYQRSLLGIRPAGMLDVPCRGCGVAIFATPGASLLCTRCAGNDDGDGGPRPTSPARMFPEAVTWTDEQLIVAIELADRREPGLNLHAVGNLPDRHEEFLDACSAELVRRLEARGVADLAA